MRADIIPTGGISEPGDTLEIGNAIDGVINIITRGAGHTTGGLVGLTDLPSRAPKLLTNHPVARNPGHQDTRLSPMDLASEVWFDFRGRRADRLIDPPPFGDGLTDASPGWYVTQAVDVWHPGHNPSDSPRSEMLSLPGQYDLLHRGTPPGFRWRY